MKRLPDLTGVSVPLAIALCAISRANVAPANVHVVVMEQGQVLCWDGQPGHTYFVQTSDPNEVPSDTLLQSWLWMPDTIDLGSGVEISHQIETTADKAFFRIWDTDKQPPEGVTPEDWDADGDGLSNNAEIKDQQSNPLISDTDGDGLPDGWEVAHGLDPLFDDAGGLFQGGPVTNLQAFAAGVQSNPSATMDDFDGDDIANVQDADQSDAVVDWLKGAEPSFALIELDLQDVEDLSLLDLTAQGTMRYRQLSEPWSHIVVDRSLQKQYVATTKPQSQGQFGTLSSASALVNDSIPGDHFTSSGTVDSLLDPYTNQYDDSWECPTGYFDDLRDERDGFLFGTNWLRPYNGYGLRYSSPYTSPGASLPGDDLLGSWMASIEANHNVVTEFGYWTWDAATNAYTDVEILPGPSRVRSATLIQTPEGQQPEKWNLVVEHDGKLMIARNLGGFRFTTNKGSLAEGNVLGVTKHGWAVGHVPQSSGPAIDCIWANGRWRPLIELLGEPAPEEGELLDILDTGLAVAKFRRTGDPWKIGLLLPINLDVNGDGNLSDECDGLTTYLPGYKGDEHVLHTGNSFLNATYAGPQAMNLILTELPDGIADSATVRIVNPSSWFGYCSNGWIPGESPILPTPDFSLVPTPYLDETQVTVSYRTLTVPIYCRDYGAWCKVEITLMKSGVPVYGMPMSLTLPNDGNGDKLADAWQDKEITAWNDQFGDSRPLNDTERDKMKPGSGHTYADYADDEEADFDGPSGLMPAMADEGDALKVIEEYRGFILDEGPSLASTEHRRLSTARKEALFQFLVMPQITDGSNPGNCANTAAQDFCVEQRFTAVQAFYHAQFPNGGADLDCYMVQLPLVPDASKIVTYQDGTSRPAYLLVEKLMPIPGSTRPSTALTYVYYDQRLWDENAVQHLDRYSPDLNTAVDYAFSRARSDAEVLAGPLTLDRFTVCAFYNRFGKYSSAANWSLGAIERDPSSFGNHLPGGTLSAPKIDPAPWGRGCQFAVNAISEDPTYQPFNGAMEYGIAHEIGHALIWARDAGHPASWPGLMANLPQAQPQPTSLSQVGGIQAVEVSSMDLRNRLSVIK